MSAYLPVHPRSCHRLRKHKFTYSETAHPASRAFFVISPMLEALPELYWINHLLTSICLSVSLTSMWQKTSSTKKENWRFHGFSGCIFTQSLHRARAYTPGIAHSTSRHCYAYNQSHGSPHELFRWGGHLQWIFASMFPLLRITVPSIYDRTVKSHLHHFLADWQSLSEGGGIVEFTEPEN